jgi:predicted permease
MSNFILILLCIAVGMAIKHKGFLPHNSHKSLNTFIIYLALPAVSFKYLPNIHWTTQLLLPALMPILIWCASWIFVFIYARITHINKQTQAALRLVTGLCNTSFVGFPLIMAYFGEERLSIAIICDQVTFALFSTVGLITAIESSGNKVAIPALIKKLFLFPPFLGCIAALVIPNFVDVSFFNPLFDKLAGTVAPLALFSIGLQLKFDGWRNEIKHVSFALLFKLFISPLIALGVVLSLSLKGEISQISVFEMAMPTLLSSSILAEEYDVKPVLANLIIGVGILLSLITTGFWYLVIE